MIKNEMRFSELATDYLSQPSEKYGKEKSDVAKRRVRQLCDEFGSRWVHEIDEIEFHRFFRNVRKKDIANATYNTYITYYRAMMHYGRDVLHCVEYVPKVKLLKEAARVEFYEPWAWEALEAQLDPLRRDIALFALLHGLRKSNVNLMRLDWIDRNLEYVSVPSWAAKNGKWNEVPLIDESKEIVTRRLKGIRELEKKFSWLPPVEYLFAQTTGKKQSLGKPLYQVTNDTWRDAIERAGLPPGMRFHSLRHTFATYHKRAGTDDRVLQKLGGWDSPKSMDRYAHVTGPELKKAAHNVTNSLRERHNLENDS